MWSVNPVLSLHPMALQRDAKVAVLCCPELSPLSIGGNGRIVEWSRLLARLAAEGVFPSEIFIHPYTSAMVASREFQRRRQTWGIWDVTSEQDPVNFFGSFYLNEYVNDYAPAPFGRAIRVVINELLPAHMCVFIDWGCHW